MCNLEEGWAAAESSVHGVVAHKQTNEHSHHSLMVPRGGQPHCCCCRKRGSSVQGDAACTVRCWGGDGWLCWDAQPIFGDLFALCMEVYLQLCVWQLRGEGDFNATWRPRVLWKDLKLARICFSFSRGKKTLKKSGHRYHYRYRILLHSVGKCVFLVLIMKKMKADISTHS